MRSPRWQLVLINANGSRLNAWVEITENRWRERTRTRGDIVYFRSPTFFWSSAESVGGICYLRSFWWWRVSGRWKLSLSHWAQSRSERLYVSVSLMLGSSSDSVGHTVRIERRSEPTVEGQSTLSPFRTVLLCDGDPKAESGKALPNLLENDSSQSHENLTVPFDNARFPRNPVFSRVKSAS